MTKPIVLGFCGLKGSGKDTAASVLIERCGYTRVSFADGLKNALSVALRTDIRYFHDPVLKETIHAPSGKKYREWMQIAGTEWFRSMWGDVWTSWWRSEIMDKGLERVVTTDLRFFNEVTAIRDPAFDSKIVRVVNPRLPPANDLHESERYASLLPADTEISNGGSIEDLRLRTLTLAGNYFKGNI